MLLGYAVQIEATTRPEGFVYFHHGLWSETLGQGLSHCLHLSFFTTREFLMPPMQSFNFDFRRNSPQFLAIFELVLVRPSISPVQESLGAAQDRLGSAQGWLGPAQDLLGRYPDCLCPFPLRPLQFLFQVAEIWI